MFHIPHIFLNYSKNTDESLDECRRVTDVCRQMKTSVDECRRVTHGPILLLLQLCNSRPHRYANSNSVVLFVITAPHNVPTPHIS